MREGTRWVNVPESQEVFLNFFLKNLSPFIHQEPFIGGIFFLRTHVSIVCYVRCFGSPQVREERAGGGFSILAPSSYWEEGCLEKDAVDLWVKFHSGLSQVCEGQSGFLAKRWGENWRRIIDSLSTQLLKGSWVNRQGESRQILPPCLSRVWRAQWFLG